jgi:hypothetical protein
MASFTAFVSASRHELCIRPVTARTDGRCLAVVRRVLRLYRRRVSPQRVGRSDRGLQTRPFPYYARLQQEGASRAFDVEILEPHGDDLASSPVNARKMVPR